MTESFDELDRRVEELRDQVRRAHRAGDKERLSRLRAELRRAEQAWHQALADDAGEDAAAGRPAGPSGAGAGGPGRGGPGRGGAGAPGQGGDGQFARRAGGMLLPLREQVHQALTLLTVPAAPRLISAVHECFFAGAIAAARLTSLRRDEERSFRAAPYARPYYLCAALTADLLAPARALVAVSTWPMESRVIGPLSPRVDYLTAAIRIAESIERIPEPSPAARRLLWRFAANVPGGTGQPGRVQPSAVAEAARTELAVHADADAATRRSAAARARAQLDDAQQLFGARLGLVSQPGAGA